eukprot:190141_1
MKILSLLLFLAITLITVDGWYRKGGHRSGSKSKSGKSISGGGYTYKRRSWSKSKKKSDSKKYWSNTKGSKTPPSYDQCDCFTLTLNGISNNYAGATCYAYTITRNYENGGCDSYLDYYIINSGSCTDCGVKVSDLAGLITSSSNDDYVFVPHYGSSDGTNVNGIKIDQKCYSG